MISTSEIKISVLIEKEHAEKAVKVIHENEIFARKKIYCKNFS